MRYFFNVYLRGQGIPDPEGTEMDCLEDVQAEALATAHELLREFPEQIDLSSLLEIVTEEGVRVFAVAIKSSSVIQNAPCEVKGCVEPCRWASPA